MHYEAKRFVKQVRRKYWWYFKNKSVLECGSLNVNGSVRSLFWFCNYIGVDIIPGKGVDQVANIADQYSEYPWMDVVVSTEMLEHDDRWRESLRSMYSQLHPGGLLIITCAGPHRAEHGTRRTEPHCSPGTPDYYRNITELDFEEALPPCLFKEYRLEYGRGKMDLYFYGIKK